MEKVSTRCLSSLLHSLALPRNGRSDGVPSNLRLSRMVFQSPSNGLVWLRCVKRPCAQSIATCWRRPSLQPFERQTSPRCRNFSPLRGYCIIHPHLHRDCRVRVSSAEKAKRGEENMGLNIQNFNMKVYKDTKGPRRSDKRNCSRQQLSTSFSPFLLDFWGFLANEGLEPRSHY
jgi:hypothetical protein